MNTVQLIKKYQSSIFIAFLFVLLLGNIITWRYCCKPETVATRGGTEVMKTGPQALHGIAFIDVDGDSVNVENVKITIIDPDGMVVTAKGNRIDKDILSPEGIISLALSPDAKFGPKNPYRYFIRAEAVGYAPNIRPVLIHRNQEDYIPIYMAKISDTHKGGLLAITGIIDNVNGGEITKDTDIRTYLYYNDKDQLPVMITFKQGTKFIFADDNPKPAGGPVSYQLTVGAMRDTNANRVKPGGFLLTDGTDSNGKPISPANPVIISTAGWLSLNMNAGGREIKGFTQPVTIAMNITDDSLRKHQSIPIWSLDDRTGKWKYEMKADVDAQRGKVEFDILHLSEWDIGFTSPVCPFGIVATYLYDPTNTTGFNDVLNDPVTNAPFVNSRFIRLVDVSTGADIKTSGNLGVFDSTRIIMMTNVPNNFNTRLLVYSGRNPDVDNVIAKSGVMTCSSPCNCIQKDNSLPASGCMQVSFRRGTSGDAAFENDLVWYRANCSGLFNFGSKVNPNGMAVLPNLTGTCCIRVRFFSPATNKEEYMEFSFNPSTPGLGMMSTSFGDPFPFDHLAGNTGSCNNGITIQIPDDVLSFLPEI